MVKNKNNTNKPKDRDGNVLKSYKREICLQTKSIKDKTKYTRKEKHKSEYSVRGKQLLLLVLTEYSDFILKITYVSLTDKAIVFETVRCEFESHRSNKI